MKDQALTITGIEESTMMVILHPKTYKSSGIWFSKMIRHFQLRAMMWELVE